MLCSKIKIEVFHDDLSSKSAGHSYVTLECLLQKLSHNQKLTSICFEQSILQQYYRDPSPAGGPCVTVSCKGYGLATLQIKNCVFTGMLCGLLLSKTSHLHNTFVMVITKVFMYTD